MDSAVAVEEVTEEAAAVDVAVDLEVAAVDEEADSATEEAEVADVVAEDHQDVVDQVVVELHEAVVDEVVAEAAQQRAVPREAPTSLSSHTDTLVSSSQKARNTSWSLATWSPASPSMEKSESASNHHQQKKELHLKRSNTEFGTHSDLSLPLVFLVDWTTFTLALDRKSFTWGLPPVHPSLTLQM